MKTALLIKTAAGLVGLRPTDPETFDLVGQPESIEAAKKLMPMLERTGNKIADMGDSFVHALYQSANDQAPAAAALVSHAEMQKRTLLDRPVVLFQIRGPFADMLETLRNVMGESNDEAAANTAKSLIDDIEKSGWITDRVFIDDQEANDFVAVQRHRYPEEDEGEAWRFYAVSAERSLNQAVRDARDISNL